MHLRVRGQVHDEVEALLAQRLAQHVRGAKQVELHEGNAVGPGVLAQVDSQDVDPVVEELQPEVGADLAEAR